LNETIAAISTPIGEGGIGIVRISGPAALGVATAVFMPAAKGAKTGVRPVELELDIEERRLYYGRVVDNNGGALDNGFLVYMKGPASYTGLDTVELHCHGGPLILKEVMAAVLAAGARPAGPGEFTRLAFTNGKLDLAQAEAVIDVIRAETASALASARGRLDGAFSTKVRGIRDGLVDLVAGIEAGLDFPEEETPDDPELLPRLIDTGRALDRLIETFDEGRSLRDGVRVLILGRPNVGKSSLLNILLQEERAIVTPAPGTTRDVIEQTVNIRGIPVRLMDTAGLRETVDPIEAVGVRLARERIAQADLILFVIDVTDFSREDVGLLDSNAMEGRKLVIAANKTDIAAPEMRAAVVQAAPGYRTVFISALTSDGIEGLKDAIYEAAAGRPFGAPGRTALGELTVSIRQKDALVKALEAAGRARRAVESEIKAPMECVAADIRAALAALGEITGETTTEDILDRIFERFCIGK